MIASTDPCLPCAHVPTLYLCPLHRCEEGRSEQDWSSTRERQGRWSQGYRKETEAKECEQDSRRKSEVNSIQRKLSVEKEFGGNILSFPNQWSFYFLFIHIFMNFMKKLMLLGIIVWLGKLRCSRWHILVMPVFWRLRQEDMKFWNTKTRESVSK